MLWPVTKRTAYITVTGVTLQKSSWIGKKQTNVLLRTEHYGNVMVNVLLVCQVKMKSCKDVKYHEGNMFDCIRLRVV